jgi:hypothetical protein
MEPVTGKEEEVKLEGVKMKNEIAILDQMVKEGMEALELLEEFDDRSKFKVWIDNHPEINEKLEKIEKEGGELDPKFYQSVGI